MMLASLLPVRDRRDRIVTYELSTAPPQERDSAALTDENARQSLALVREFLRLSGKMLLVPITPALMRDGSLSRVVGSDVTLLLSSSALDDVANRRALERVHGSGLRFAFDGWSDSFADAESIAPVMHGSIVTLDARRTEPLVLAGQLRRLVDAGMRPLVRGIDDRAARLRVMAQGAMFYTGRTLTRGAAVPVHRPTQDSAMRAILTLAEYADGRPPDASFDEVVRSNPHLSAALLKSVGSAAIGVRNPRSVTHAMNLLGRDAVLESLANVGARLLGEMVQDQEFALAALRRVRLCERIGSALDPAPHPRARMVAGLLSMVEYATAVPPAVLREGDLRGLSPVLQDAMVERQQPLGALLDLVDAIETGWWSDLRTRCRMLSVNPLIVAEAYVEAWRSARDEFAAASPL